MKTKPSREELLQAVDRMDALLKVGLGLLAVGDFSATAIAARKDMAMIRLAIFGEAAKGKDAEAS